LSASDILAGGIAAVLTSKARALATPEDKAAGIVRLTLSLLSEDDVLLEAMQAAVEEMGSPELLSTDETGLRKLATLTASNLEDRLGV